MCSISHDNSAKIWSHVNNEKGVTLVEIMVYMVIAGMLLGTAVMAYLGQNKSYNRQDIIAETQQNIRASLARMVPEIRMAGFDPAEKGAGFTAATQNILSFNYWQDSNGDGEYDDKINISYELNATNEIVEEVEDTTGVLTTGVLAENIDELRFEYLYYNFNTKDWAWANDVTAIRVALGIPTESKALEQIRAVKIILLGRARPSAFAVTDTAVYTPPLEGSGAGETWTPAAGSGDNRLMSVVVQCRNNRG